ncbi:DUF1453 domain-containing protein [Amycolatopsis sp. NPDC059657]|uniref:DUF1453 domain-containing protein n=1 Tax=Amycolatopsis sp. NPDC059657 TaxID=3346899 RepID=UPI0036719E7E
MGFWSIAAIVVVVIVVIVKRLIGEPLNARDLVIPPLVLIGIGVWSLRKIELTGLDIAWLAGGSALGLGMGALRGTTLRLFAKDGVLWQRYTGWTFGVWVLSIAVNGGFGFLAVAGGMHTDARPMPLSIGISLLGEMVVVGLRALRTGVPFAPERKSVLGRR